MNHDLVSKVIEENEISVSNKYLTLWTVHMKKDIMSNYAKKPKSSTSSEPSIDDPALEDFDTIGRYSTQNVICLLWILE